MAFASKKAARRLVPFGYLVLVGLFAVLGALARLLAVAPAFVGFAVTVMIACAWCYWLDGHGGGSTKS